MFLSERGVFFYCIVMWKRILNANHKNNFLLLR